MSQPVKLEQIGTIGMEPDLMPQARDVRSFDMGTNVRSIGPNIGNAGGYVIAPNSTTTHDPTTILLSRSLTARQLVLPGNTAIYRYDGVNLLDITGDPVADTVGRRWHGGWLAGCIVLANEKAVRTWRPDVDANTIPMEWTSGQTWESLNYRARVFRNFRGHCLAANIFEDANYFPHRVRWSDVVEPGDVPKEWVAGADNRAGDVDLSDTVGSVVDMVKLRESLIVYKRDAIWSCQWVGGNEVFSFRPLVTNRGLYARDCVIEYNGRHYVQGIEDIYIFDGNAPYSIIYGRVKNAWLADRDAERAINNWTALDNVNEEILFGYVSKDAPGGYQFPNKALVLNLRNDSWWFRDYGTEMPHAKASLEIKSAPATANFVLYGIDNIGNRLLALEAAPDRDGSPVAAQLLRTGLFSDYSEDRLQVDSVQLKITGANATLRLGGQQANDAPIDWRGDFIIDPSTDYKTDARQNTRQLAFQIDINATTAWQISGINAFVQPTGHGGG